ncbi:MAG: VOC family protein, partial [Lachnospiraceae bacterium]|nr:VOC family protein [Lachnospiraceae bacterium]
MIKGIRHVSIKCIKEDYEKVKSFYTEILGLKDLRQWPDGAMLEIGGDIVEIFNNGTDRLPKGVITHIAFFTDDPDELTKRVKDAGYEVFMEPNDKTISSNPPYPIRVAFCYGPLGEEI